MLSLEKGRKRPITAPGIQPKSEGIDGDSRVNLSTENRRAQGALLTQDGLSGAVDQ
jgi:hypothetical protein